MACLPKCFDEGMAHPCACLPTGRQAQGRAFTSSPHIFLFVMLSLSKHKQKNVAGFPFYPLRKYKQPIQTRLAGTPATHLGGAARRVGTSARRVG